MLDLAWCCWWGLGGCFFGCCSHRDEEDFDEWELNALADHIFAKHHHYVHMVKEEKVLFPHIVNMAKALRIGTAIPRAPFGTIANSIQTMEAEHESAGNGLEVIRQLSDDFHATN